ncbi:MAG: hypothetical protein ABIR71_06465 [Chthoniobacterales bacterium]
MNSLLHKACAGLALSLALTLATARADTVASFTGGPGSAAVAIYPGQSFTSVASDPLSNITFNFFSNANPATTPFALGTGFLLSTQFAGSPRD